MAANSVVLDSVRSDLIKENQKNEKLETEMKNIEIKHRQEVAAWESKYEKLESEQRSMIVSLTKDITMLKKQNLKMKLERLLEIEDHLETFQLIKADLENQAEGWMEKWLCLFGDYYLKNIR